MDDFRLRVFVTAAHTLNFSRCAQQLGISQPAVSNHIKELEHIYSIKLFERQVSGLYLTPIGRLFLAKAEDILSRYAGLACEMKVASSAQKLSELRIIASENFSRYILPEVVAKFMQLAPYVYVTIRTDSNDNVENYLEQGVADLGFVEKTENEFGWHYEYEKIIKDDIFLVAGQESNIKNPFVTLEDLKDMTFVQNKQDIDLIEDVNTILSQKDLSLNKLNVAMWLESTEAVKRIVAQGNMVAFVSRAAITRELASGELRIVDIDAFKASRYFSAVALRGQLNGAKKEFCSLVKEMMSR